MLLVQQTKVPIKLLVSRLHKMNMISQAVAGGLEDARAVKGPFSIALTHDNSGLHFDVTVNIGEFLRAIFHFPV